MMMKSNETNCILIDILSDRIMENQGTFSILQEIF